MPVLSDTVTVRMFAAARAAAGSSVLHVPPGPLNAMFAELSGSLPARFTQVLAVSSLVCDGVRLDLDELTAIPAGAVIDVLPPFAGG